MPSLGAGSSSAYFAQGRRSRGYPAIRNAPTRDAGLTRPCWRVADNFGRDRRGILSTHAPPSAQDVLYKHLFPITVRSVAPPIVVLVFGGAVSSETPPSSISVAVDKSRTCLRARPPSASRVRRREKRTQCEKVT